VRWSEIRSMHYVVLPPAASCICMHHLPVPFHSRAFNIWYKFAGLLSAVAEGPRATEQFAAVVAVFVAALAASARAQDISARFLEQLVARLEQVRTLTPLCCVASFLRCNTRLTGFRGINCDDVQLRKLNRLL